MRLRDASEEDPEIRSLLLYARQVVVVIIITIIIITITIIIIIIIIVVGGSRPQDLAGTFAHGSYERQRQQQQVESLSR